MTKIAVKVKPRLQPELFTYAFPVRVYFENTDAGGVVYHAEYLKFLERARTEWLRHLGHDHQALARQHKVVFVVAGLTIDYLKPAKLDDNLSVTVQLDVLSKVRAEFAQEVRREAEVLTRARVTIVCVDAETFRPAEIPEPLKRKMQASLA